MNAALGTAQHIKAEKSLNSLKALASPTAKVLRNGQTVEIPSREVVVGDILYLDDYGSGRWKNHCESQSPGNESSLTGESLANKELEPIEEADVSLGDRKNMIFSAKLLRMEGQLQLSRILACKPRLVRLPVC